MLKYPEMDLNSILGQIWEPRTRHFHSGLIDLRAPCQSKLSLGLSLSVWLTIIMCESRDDFPSAVRRRYHYKYTMWRFLSQPASHSVNNENYRALCCVVIINITSQPSMRTTTVMGRAERQCSNNSGRERVQRKRTERTAVRVVFVAPSRVISNRVAGNVQP